MKPTKIVEKLSRDSKKTHFKQTFILASIDVCYFFTIEIIKFLNLKQYSVLERFRSHGIFSIFIS